MRTHDRAGGAGGDGKGSVGALRKVVANACVLAVDTGRVGGQAGEARIVGLSLTAVFGAELHARKR